MFGGGAGPPKPWRLARCFHRSGLETLVADIATERTQSVNNHVRWLQLYSSLGPALGNG